MATRMVVFDMDGTLVQARSAAWEVFQETATRFDLPVHSAEAFFDLFRSNFFEELDRLCGRGQRAEEVRTHFMTALRERYTPNLVPGMADVIKALAPHYALSVMSSNAMEAIRRTLESAGVAHCFAHVFSADVDPSKAGHLRKILSDPAYAGVRACSAAYVEDHPPPTGDEVVLVTDTVGDVGEGREAGVHIVGVTWGMHSEASLKEAGAEFVACWPQELISRLLPGGSCKPGGCHCTLDTCASTGSCTVLGAPPAPVVLPMPVTIRTPVPIPDTLPTTPKWPATHPATVAAGIRQRRRRTNGRTNDRPGPIDTDLAAALARIAPPLVTVTTHARRNAE